MTYIAEEKTHPTGRARLIPVLTMDRTKVDEISTQHEVGCGEQRNSVKTKTRLPQRQRCVVGTIQIAIVLQNVRTVQTTRVVLD